MKKQTQEQNDNLLFAEATIGSLLVSCRDWLDSEIKESGEDFIRGVMLKITTRHPSMGWMVDSLEF